MLGEVVRNSLRVDIYLSSDLDEKQELALGHPGEECFQADQMAST